MPLEFTDEEKILITLSLKKGYKFWDDKKLDKLKRKIKNHLRDIQRECCCYCCRSFDDEFNMVLDIEHIIPKSKIETEMFEILNLAVSCKRCNMRIKGEKVDFIEGAFDEFKRGNQYYLPEKYKFLHPNLDSWDNHLAYKIKQLNRNKIVYYDILNDSSKGKYTKDYFELAKIQVNTFDEAQDATERKVPESPAVARAFNSLLKRMFNL